MDYTIVIKKILSKIDLAFESRNYNKDTINPSELAISTNKLCLILEGLLKEEYITGFKIDLSNKNNENWIVDVTNPRLTLKGLQFLYKK